MIDGIEIIGSGPMLLPGIQVLRASGRSDFLRGAGPIAHEAVPSHLRTSSILVLPSRDEGMPACVLEAMACGLAVVATPVGGIPEVVRHGETGLLVAPGDHGGLVRACRLLAEQVDLRERLGRNARALVASRFDALTSFAATRRLIKGAIESAPPSPESRPPVDAGEPSRAMMTR
jgi:glycogen synthase